MKIKPKPSLKPQNLDRDCWYYENKGSIDLIVTDVGGPWFNARKRKGKIHGDSRSAHVRIPSAMLLATLKRQGKWRSTQR